MSSKKKILAWSDYVGAGTGFGVVSRYVLKALHATGDYEISQLGINYHGEFFDQNEYPYQVVPAKLKDPRDPYGQQSFLDTVARGDFDYIWIMNDNFVVEKVGQKLPELLKQMRGAGKKIPFVLYYYPVDCHVLPEASSMIKMADVPVVYTQYGKVDTLKSIPEIEPSLQVLPHGTDSSLFHRLPEAERAALKMQLLRVSPDTFIWLNVNRNSPRKDLPRTIMAFKEFKKKVPNSRLFLHTMRDDVGGKLDNALRELGLNDKTDVIFPDARYGPHNPLPTNVLNMFYNTADAFITTTLGEGWGLTHFDAMLQRVPVLVPDNTVFPEQMADGKRGYLYKCEDLTWVDSSGYRPQGLIPEITDKMMQVYRDVLTGENKQILDNAEAYAKSLDWKNIGDMWIQLFKEATFKDQATSNLAKMGQVL